MTTTSDGWDAKDEAWFVALYHARLLDEPNRIGSRSVWAIGRHKDNNPRLPWGQSQFSQDVNSMKVVEESTLALRINGAYMFGTPVVCGRSQDHGLVDKDGQLLGLRLYSPSNDKILWCSSACWERTWNRIIDQLWPTRTRDVPHALFGTPSHHARLIEQLVFAYARPMVLGLAIE